MGRYHHGARPLDTYRPRRPRRVRARANPHPHRRGPRAPRRTARASAASQSSPHTRKRRPFAGATRASQSARSRAPTMSVRVRFRGSPARLFAVRATFGRMSETRPNSAATVRTFTISTPVQACRLRRDDLRQLYRIIQERQNDHRQTVLAHLSQLPTESADEFETRRTRVANAFVTTVNITLARSKEVITDSSEHFVTSENLPDNIVTVFFSTIAGPSANWYSRTAAATPRDTTS
jgi:hypothetical protein